MQKLTDTQVALRAALGPGFQAGGPTDLTLRLVTPKPRR
jgi:hypothetical protein